MINPKPHVIYISKQSGDIESMTVLAVLFRLNILSSAFAHFSFIIVDLPIALLLSIFDIRARNFFRYCIGLNGPQKENKLSLGVLRFQIPSPISSKHMESLWHHRTRTEYHPSGFPLIQSASRRNGVTIKFGQEHVGLAVEFEAVTQRIAIKQVIP